MLVGERMTRNPVTILETASIDDGIHLMRERRVRRLPVLDSSGKMVGIVSDKDLLHAAPSPATSLSVYELHYLLARLTIKQVMSSPVISVTADTPIEEAAAVMADHKIGGLPVVEGGRLVGIISERDIARSLRAFRDLNDTASKQYARIYNILVSDVMTHDVQYVYVETPLEEVKKIILEEDRGGLPVLNRREEVVGMITRRSILDYLARTR